MPRRHRRQMRREQHGSAKRHFHLGGVAVVEQAISGEASVDRAEGGRFLCFAAGAADARGGVDDHASGLTRPASTSGFSARIAAVA